MAKFSETTEDNKLKKSKTCNIYMHIDGTLKDKTHCKEYLENSIYTMMCEITNMFENRKSINVEVDVLD